jgi:deazaflavin-dependent oxidoreductase (nitroreductase family)
MAVQQKATTSARSSANHGGTRVPFFVPLFNPIARRLMRLGVPLGPNALLSVRGRKTGVVRTTPVAMIKADGRRWIVGTFGEVNWVRNLRSAGEAVVTVGRRKESVRATELDHADAERFFVEILGPDFGRSRLGRWMIGTVLAAPELLEDPHGAAERVPVFELQALAPTG